MKDNSTFDKVDLLEIYNILFENIRSIVYATIIFTVIGIIYSLSLTNLYKSSSTFYPHYENNAGGNISNLANIAGFNFNNQSNNIPSILYPMLLKSTPFKREILNEKIYFNEIYITYKDYLLIKNDRSSFLSILNFPKKIFSKLYTQKNNNQLKNDSINSSILSVNEEDYRLHMLLDNLIEINLNESDGFIELNVYDENPFISSQIAKKSEEILQESIINFKIKNVKETYDFTSKALDIAKTNLFKLQDSLALFRDSNKNIKSDLFKNQLNRIETEFNISKNIYNELAITKEKTAIEVRKNTPIFTIINPVVIPNEKIYPTRKKIVIISTFIGLALSSILLILRFYLFK